MREELPFIARFYAVLAVAMLPFLFVGWWIYVGILVVFVWSAGIVLALMWVADR